MRGKRRERFVYRGCQHGKSLEVLVMGRPLLCLLPQICNRMVIRRIRWQGLRRDARAMGGQKRLGRCAGVIPSAIVDQQQMLRGVRHHHW